MIAANRVPDHATIARFRVRHQEALAGFFGQVLGLCAQAGLVRVGVIAVDPDAGGRGLGRDERDDRGHHVDRVRRCDELSRLSE